MYVVCACVFVCHIWICKSACSLFRPTNLFALVSTHACALIVCRILVKLDLYSNSAAHTFTHLASAGQLESFERDGETVFGHKAD